MKRGKFKEPVKWLLGKQLISGIKWIAIYAFYGEKLDSRDWMRAESIEEDQIQDFLKPWQQQESDVFWFDYFADSGDGQQSTYNMAYLAMSDLWLNNETTASGLDEVSLNQNQNKYKLPRGEFLFVGGDTAYHIADFSTLAERFQKPFNYAYHDIFGDQENPNHKKAIFAIPGNHDYYDALDGFHRQFCKPVKFPTGHPHATDPKYSAQLDLKGFNRYQQASYVALKLPFNWFFWGIDCQEGKLDVRQQAFFLSTCSTTESGQLKTPDKLIIATPEPTTKFGLWADENAEITRTFKEKLCVEPCFLKKHNGALDKLDNSKCRLDISGDIHHYQRYWGQFQDEKSPTPNYASVVSGGGGAFLHATHTDLGEVEAKQCYPTREDSFHLMLKQLLNPSNIIMGGSIWLAGGILALVTYFALTIPDSSWSVFSEISSNSLIPNNLRPCGGPECDDSLLNRIQEMLQIDNFNNMGKKYTVDYVGMAYIFCLLFTLVYAIRWITDKKHRNNIVCATQEQWKRYSKFFWIFLPVPIYLTVLLIYFQRTGSDTLHPISVSLLALLFLVATMLIFILSRLLADTLTRRKKYTEFEGNTHLHLSWYDQELPTWFLIGMAIVTACFGSWRYGINSAAIALTDTLSLTIILLGFFGLIALAWFSGSALLVNKRKNHFLLIGFWHAVLQFLLPLLLVVYADWQGMLLIVGFVTLSSLYTPRLPIFNIDAGELSLAKQEKKARQLFLIWFVLGLAAILLVLLFYGGEPKEVTWGRFIAVFFLGALLSCVWFGWYLAVSLGFNGHNNEAGGGARTAKYRHFIRFKLTENTLTGYVIGVDDPKINFSKDKTFRLVDVFTVNAPNPKASTRN